jgi:hypothetical protein
MPIKMLTDDFAIGEGQKLPRLIPWSVAKRHHNINTNTLFPIPQRIANLFYIKKAKLLSHTLREGATKLFIEMTIIASAKTFNLWRAQNENGKQKKKTLCLFVVWRTRRELIRKQKLRDR